MSLIGKNIKKIRTIKKLSQAKFAELFNLARPSVGAYEEGRSEPKIDTIILISKHFGLSVDSLLTRDITVNELAHFDIVDPLKASLGPRLTNNMPYVTKNDTEDYAQAGDSRQFIKARPIVTVPLHLNDGVAIEIKDSGLHDIRPGDTLFTTPAKVNELRNGHAYLIRSSQRIECLRFLDGVLKTDSPYSAPIDPNDENILEIRTIRAILSKYQATREPAQHRNLWMEERLNALEKRIEKLEATEG
ncbi:hypothetical protein FUAX_08550 [Fulvitalea axinellae]|uniref:HTH cro/C1-type domain-containing protein n=1 Tax=Fulvitalea axinellae TaxID=1182444 RepID=A0AAU9CXR2_9BACT|nr:hypothetical protein FUAX_08550 [Fulvitalea axinellae]